VALVIVLGLIAWLAVPDRDDSTGVKAVGSRAAAATAEQGSAGPAAGGTAGAVDGSGSAAPSESSAAASGGTPSSGGTTSSALTGGNASAASSGATTAAASVAKSSGGCQSPPGSAKGISATEVRVAIALTEIIGPAANQLFDVPTPAQAKADFDAAIAGINGEGGVACRKLVATYYNINPVDESGMMQFCRNVADAGFFAVVDTGSLATRPAVLACFGQLKVPYFGAYYITQTARQQFYPYIFSFYYKEEVYKDTAFGLRDLGFFDPAKGFKKLGFIYRDCEREAITALRGWIRAAGVPDSLVVTYNVGCPAVFANETDLAQAVLTFKRDGVTHVLPGNFQGDIARFTSHAEQQSFRPKYGFPDEALLSIAGGSRAPDPNNIVNAVAITLGRDAEQRTAGLSPTPGTLKCNAYRKAAGLKPVYEVPANAGHACDQLWMLQAALSRAPQLSVSGLVSGLQQTKSIDFSFPQGPNDFTGNRVTTGGQFFRAAQFMPDCKCWRVIQRDFRRGY
jgi:hypothetical protein